MVDERAIARAYDGSTAIFRSLQAWGWGELINLGYYRPLELWRVLLGMDHFQRVLARRSVALLEVEPGQRVLDVGCGRGGTTRLIAAQGAQVVGIDLLKENIEQALSRVSGPRDASYRVGDARHLVECTEAAGFAPGEVDAVHCLESAFYFGAEGRARFLAEAFRVLRPGGRLVLVDFVWRTNAPEEIETVDPDRLVRNTWGYEQFEPVERYRERARAVGFRELQLLDWTRPVIGRFLALCELLCAFARLEPGRACFRLVRPGLRSLTREDWEDVVRVVRAHRPVRRRSRYVAFVLEKPEGLTRKGVLRHNVGDDAISPRG